MADRDATAMPMDVRLMQSAATLLFAGLVALVVGLGAWWLLGNPALAVHQIVVTGDTEHNTAASLQDIRQAPVAKTLEISACWIRLLPAQIPSAAYFVIKNSGAEAAQIDAAASPAFASVMLHRTTEKDGVSRMSASGDLTIPAGGELAFKPGGYHAMLEQPTAPLAVGQTVTIEFLTGNHEHVSAACQVKPATAIGD